VYSAYHDKDHGIWLGTLYGLYVFQKGNAYFKGDISPFLSERISCIDKMKEYLVVGTTAHGILFLKDDTIAYHLTNENGLLGTSIKALFIQDDSTAWVGTRLGLNKIVMDIDKQDFHIESYGHSDGLPSSEINSISMHDGHVWLGTGRGLVSFNPVNLTPHMVPPVINISSIRLMGKDTSILEQYDLPYDQNSIRIEFKGITYRKEENMRYRYMLSNYQDQIVETKNDWVLFPNLPPGEYTFFVNVGNVHGNWNEAPERIDFRIRKHYTQTLWFIILLILATLASLALITIFFQRQRKIKQNARNDLLRMEQKLFRLQMNPHFVFNALLAIQGYMYMNKPQEAGRYLTSFAKMIRHTLYGSSEEYITLDKEMQALQYYLELQRLRFNEHFNFSIELDDEIIPESMLIPPLLLQPFLENAIEHGLQHKKEGGMLYVRLKADVDCLMIEIEDDGIGREESVKLQKEKGKLHKSMGMDIVRKRVESLNKILSQRIRLEITDLKNEDGKAAGTLVRMCIPFRSA
jgi:signal transduction histidine kinase